VTVLVEGEEFPEMRRSPILFEAREELLLFGSREELLLFGSREKPLLLWREASHVFSREESLGGGDKQKKGTRSSPPRKSWTS
jgi:hypothetical protein